ncbi:hypothetical protein PTKIN_Ptkin14bG0080100 [Pterospermum kingtungense]
MLNLTLLLVEQDITVNFKLNGVYRAIPLNPATIRLPVLIDRVKNAFSIDESIGGDRIRLLHGAVILNENTVRDIRPGWEKCQEVESGESQQKIIIQVSLHCSKCRTKALKIAAVADGVTSVAFHGPEKDKLLIIGDGVDAACLTACLRKKLCYASLEIVEEEKEEKKEPAKSEPPKDPIVCYCPQQPQFECYKVVADPSRGPCTIM